MAPKRKASVPRKSLSADDPEFSLAKKVKQVAPAKIVKAEAAGKVSKAKPKAAPKPRALPAKRRAAKSAKKYTSPNSDSSSSSSSSSSDNSDTDKQIESEDAPNLRKLRAQPARKQAAAQAVKELSPKSKSEGSPLSLAPDGSPDAKEADVSSNPKRVIIEHCKQCASFKTRALKVFDALKIALPNVEISINPEKPRKGCFEVREEDGQVFISLLDMPRPFKKMKDLNMDEVIADIVSKLKN